ncbi:MAG TPA: GMC family oxidoreductase [Rhodothermales bacterium]|nr:GMC family oxidoreductase [Rhodothermales bacterium]
MRTLESGTLLEGDICIVGAGAAGITMAREWIGTPYKVLLLEGGGFNYEYEMQELYRGDIVGQRYYPLETARLHYFGGTTGHWAGWCSLFEEIDFQKRDWVPHSGWPIRRSDLDPYYPRAQPIVELGPYDYDAAHYEAQGPEMARLPLDESKVWPKMWQFSPPTRFGTKYRDEIVGAQNVHLFTYADVVDVEANEGVSNIRQLHLRTLEGKEYRAKARYYILACGAMQNARLLLASNKQAPKGLGNDNDLVGRFFMEHLEVPSAQLTLAAPRPMKLYLWVPGGTKARAELAITAEEQRRQRILNCTLSLSPGVEDVEQSDRIASFTENNARYRDRSWNTGDGPHFDFAHQRQYGMMARLEQAPNPNSRITLSDEKDALGMPRVKLDWELTPLDRRSIRTTVEIVAREMGRTGLGRVQIDDWLLEPDDAPWPTALAAGWHHMGTVRMHEDPKQGVVDAHQKMHGVDNLYIASTAVYTTAGEVNPTLTLIALTLRLSDYLKQVVA